MIENAKGGFRGVNVTEMFIITLIGGIYFIVLGFIATFIAVKKKEKLNPMGTLYLFGGLAISIISYKMY